MTGAHVTVGSTESENDAKVALVPCGGTIGCGATRTSVRHYTSGGTLYTDVGLLTCDPPPREMWSRFFTIS